MKYTCLAFSILFMSCKTFDYCQNKELFIQKHKSFVEETVNNVDSYSDEEWDRRNEEFEKFMNDCYENVKEDMSKEEKKEFWITNTKYFTARLKSNGEEGFENLKNILEGITVNGKHFVDGIDNVLGEDLELTIEEFGDEIIDIFDEDFENKIKEVFDEDLKNDLEKALNKLGKNLESLADDFKEILEEE